MAASYDEFKTEHRADHQLRFNRWCAAIGNPLIIVGQGLMLVGRWRRGAALAGSGGAIIVAGHLAEGTLGRAGRELGRHPVWGIRADVELAYDTIAGVVTPRT